LFLPGFLFFRQRPFRLRLGRLLVWSLIGLRVRGAVGSLLIRWPLTSSIGLLLILLLASLIRLLLIRWPLTSPIGLLLILLFASLIRLLLIRLPLASPIGLLLILLLASLIRLLLIRLPLASPIGLLLILLLLASLVGLLLFLLFAGFIGLLLVLLLFSSLIGLLLSLLPLPGLIGLLLFLLLLSSLVGLLLFLLFAGFIGLLLILLLFASLIGLLLSLLPLASLFLLLLLGCLLFASLVRLLLLTSLIRLLLSRWRPVVPTRLGPLAWRVRFWGIGGLVCRVVRWRRICRLPRTTNSWLSTRTVGVRSVCIRRRGFSRRRLPDLGSLCCSSCRTHSLDFMSSERLAGVRFERFLLLFKCHRRRGRRSFCHYRPLGNCCRRPSHTIGIRRCRSENTVSRGSHRCPPVDGRRGNLLLIDDNHGSRHRLRAVKCALRNCGYSAPDRPVNVGDVSDVIIRDLRVVNVCDGRGRDGRVAHIDAVHVTTADVIRRHINFPRAQREPTHIHTEPASASASNKHH
jgi:hypothetical protein